MLVRPTNWPYSVVLRHQPGPSTLRTNLTVAVAAVAAGANTKKQLEACRAQAVALTVQRGQLHDDDTSQDQDAASRVPPSSPSPPLTSPAAVIALSRRPGGECGLGWNTADVPLKLARVPPLHETVAARHHCWRLRPLRMRRCCRGPRCSLRAHRQPAAVHKKPTDEVRQTTSSSKTN